MSISTKTGTTLGLSPTVEDLIKQVLIIPCTSPCNTLNLPIKKPNGQSWRFMQDLHAIDKTVILRFPIVPNPNTLFPNVPTDSKWITVVDLRLCFL